MTSVMTGTEALVALTLVLLEERAARQHGEDRACADAEHYERLWQALNTSDEDGGAT